MQQLHRLIYILGFSVALLAAGCSKDDDNRTPAPEPVPTPTPTPPPPPPPVYNPTPFQIVAPGYFGAIQIPAGNPTTEEGVLLGRMLFYETKLSKNNSISCATCHQQEFAFTDGKALSPGFDGTNGTRSTMSLANSAWFKHLMWDGSATSLEQQARMPIVNHIEMGSTMQEVVQKLQNTDNYPQRFFAAFGSDSVTEENILKALAQFQRTLVSANSKFDRYLQRTEDLSPAEKRGYELFRTHPESTLFPPIRGGNCGDCHGSTGLLALDFFKNNGLDASPTDNGRGGVTGNSFDNHLFKVPTLRNIALTAPYMHDGRFQTLEQVLDFYNEHVQHNSPNLSVDMTATNHPMGPGPGQQLALTAQQKADIIAFLHTLTDTEFVTNPKFSDPFKQ